MSQMHDYIQLKLDGGEQLMHVINEVPQPCVGIIHCRVCRSYSWKPATDTGVPWHELKGDR